MRQRERSRSNRSRTGVGDMAAGMVVPALRRLSSAMLIEAKKDVLSRDPNEAIEAFEWLTGQTKAEPTLTARACFEACGMDYDGWLEREGRQMVWHLMPNRSFAAVEPTKKRPSR